MCPQVLLMLYFAICSWPPFGFIGSLSRIIRRAKYFLLPWFPLRPRLVSCPPVLPRCYRCPYWLVECLEGSRYATSCSPFPCQSLAPWILSLEDLHSFDLLGGLCRLFVACDLPVLFLLLIINIGKDLSTIYHA